MILASWDNTCKDLQQLLGRTRSRAEQGIAHLNVLGRQAESGKITFLIDMANSRRRAVAEVRGMRSFSKDRSGLGALLGGAAINFIGTAFITQDTGEVLSAGLGAVNKGFQSRGETEWVVNLDSFAVAPSDSHLQGMRWVEWPGLIAALEQLKEHAEAAEPMGDMPKIKEALIGSKLLVFVIFLRI